MMDLSNIIDRVLDPFRGPTHLTLADRVELAKAPRLSDPRLDAPPRPGGTTVRVKAADAVFQGDPFKHMYAEFDDGRDSYIYRGGPGPGGAVSAGVVPAHLSRDYGKGKEVLYERFLPGVSAAQAVAPARADADRINRSGDPYLGLSSNSNSVIGGFTARQYGHRVGQPLRTPGYAFDLPDKWPAAERTPSFPSPY